MNVKVNEEIILKKRVSKKRAIGTTNPATPPFSTREATILQSVENLRSLLPYGVLDRHLEVASPETDAAGVRPVVGIGMVDVALFGVADAAVGRHSAALAHHVAGLAVVGDEQHRFDAQHVDQHVGHVGILDVHHVHQAVDVTAGVVRVQAHLVLAHVVPLRGSKNSVKKGNKQVRLLK